MPSKSKIKGSSFERDIAKYLSDIYGESFIRAPGSGAYVGGKNQVRKQFLHEGQVRSFKGDIVPGQSFNKFNAECKSYQNFPFHQLFTGNCKLLDTWLQQMLDVAEEDDMSILFMKFNNIGKFVAVEANKTWIADNFFHYTSNGSGDWIILEFNDFFKHNRDLLKVYSGSNITHTTENNTPNIITLQI